MVDCITPEDAPAPAALHSFAAEIVNGKIQVTADPSATLSANKSRQPKLLATGSGQGKGVVIVGGGSGAFMCIESPREVGFVNRIQRRRVTDMFSRSMGTTVPLLYFQRSRMLPLIGEASRRDS